MKQISWEIIWFVNKSLVYDNWSGERKPENYHRNIKPVLNSGSSSLFPYAFLALNLESLIMHILAWLAFGESPIPTYKTKSHSSEDLKYFPELEIFISFTYREFKDTCKAENQVWLHPFTK